MKEDVECTYNGYALPCASCGTGIERNEVRGPRQLLVGGECCEDEEDLEWFKDWHFGSAKPCVFHEGCWKLLIKHFDGGLIPADKLADVVKEAPYPKYEECELLLPSLYPNVRDHD
ncbi:hypothetical protein N7488_009195 [Penicillium malachiteum]|nr:hypothetical protein N7488_009195 [Penicillium malachiteum]